MSFLKNSIVFLCLIPGLLFSQSGKKNEFIVVKLNEAFADQQRVLLSRFINTLQFVPLETTSEAVISNTSKIDVSGDYIIVLNKPGSLKYQILLFDRNTGKFLREIGKQGRGPGEYHALSEIPVNSQNKEIYAIGASREILAYNMSGALTGKIKTPEWIDPDIQIESFRRVMISIEDMLDDTTFCGYVINYSGWEKRKIVLFSNSGIVKVFPNTLTYKKTIPDSWHFSTTRSARFYKWNGNLYFIEAFCDTLYQVTRESLIPRYYFDWGRYNLPYSRQDQIMRDGKFYEYFSITDIDENSDFIFVRICFDQNFYTAFVNKNNNKVTFCKPGNSGRSGLSDDISGLMEVVPQGFTEENEMVFVIRPEDLFKWFLQNPGEETKARNRYPWLKNINEFSNPIVAIGKCNVPAYGRQLLK